jgi:hypothetical protein
VSPWKEAYINHVAKVGRCRLTVSKPVLKASMVSALEATVLVSKPVLKVPMVSALEAKIR